MKVPSREQLHGGVRMVGLFAFVVTLPFSMTVNNAAIMIMAVNWLLESPLRLKMERAKRNPNVLLFVSLYVLSALALIYTSNTSQGLFELEKRLGMLAFPLILATSNPIKKKEIRLLFVGFIGACTVGSLICFAFAIQRNYSEGHTLTYVYNAVFHDIHLPGRYDYFNYWYFTYSWFAEGIGLHQTYFAMYTIFSSCLVVWLWRDNGTRSGMGVWIVFLLIYNFVVVILLSSRTQVFGMMLIGTAFILYYSYIHKRIFSAVVVIGLFYSIAFIILFSNPINRERFFESMRPSAHFSENKYGEGGFSLRKYEWVYAIETIGKFPLLGCGPGDADDELQLTYKKNNFTIGYVNVLNAHNQYLQTSLELGIVGLVCLLTGLALPCYHAFKDGAWLYLVFIFLFSFSCITESMLELNKGIIFYAFFNSLFAFQFRGSSTT